MTTPPDSIDELMGRADALAGRTLRELADGIGVEVPEDLSRNKGWIGQLIERVLGAPGDNASEPDFADLGVELKTIPVDRNSKPKESTYVCMVPLAEPDDVDWPTSVVRLKLQRVLWVPILHDPTIPLGGRIVGQPILWEPDPYELALLQHDWEGHLDAIRHGAADELRGEDGKVLQVRPKGANASQLAWTIDERGEAIMTQPRGFYLRTLFTEMLIRRGLD